MTSAIAIFLFGFLFGAGALFAVVTGVVMYNIVDRLWRFVTKESS